MMVHASATGLPLREVCPAIVVEIWEDWTGKVRSQSCFLSPRKACDYVAYAEASGVLPDRIHVSVARVARTFIRRWDGHSL